ncbi:MAG: carbohydrate porin [Akkermansia sp.]|nr:carbohydrate porin [Akkermansia sp.]
MKIRIIRTLWAALLIGGTALGAETPSTPAKYLDTAMGWNPYEMNSGQLPRSLSRSMAAHTQMARRHAGVPTHEKLLVQQREHAARNMGLQLGSWLLFPQTPQHFMPYLDSVFVPGNTCAEPCQIIGEDAISSGAQQVKKMLSRVGLQYDMTLSYNYTKLASYSGHQRSDFSAFNNSVSGTWFLAKDSDNSQGIFLVFEADWGHGINFNERRSSAQQSLGSLSNPQGSLRGGNGVFLPQLALGYSGFDGTFVAMAGVLDTSNYLDQNAYSASWSGNLTNGAFNLNPCLPLEWANWGYLTAWQPNPHFYTMYATTGCNGEINHSPFQYISSNAWVHVGEVGFITEDFFGFGPGTYRFQYTLTRNKGETGSGVAINFQQQLGAESRLGFFTRCGFMDPDAAAVNNVSACATAGLVLQAPFRSQGWGSRSNNDQVALGFFWERAAATNKPYEHKNEYGLELSAVVQLTPTFFLQPDLQYIFDPIHSDDGSGAFVFQLQGVFKF